MTPTCGHGTHANARLRRYPQRVSALQMLRLWWCTTRKNTTSIPPVHNLVKYWQEYRPRDDDLNPGEHGMLDELDLGLISQLQENGRAPVTELARPLKRPTANAPTSSEPAQTPGNSPARSTSRVSGASPADTLALYFDTNRPPGNHVSIPQVASTVDRTPSRFVPSQPPPKSSRASSSPIRAQLSQAWCTKL